MKLLNQFVLATTSSHTNTEKTGKGVTCHSSRDGGHAWTQQRGLLLSKAD